jgi:hypothetical protein
MTILKYFDFPKSDLTLLINGKQNIKIGFGGILNMIWLKKKILIYSYKI